jgi:glycosyltransferase involved in cell wall biosynthesis
MGLRATPRMTGVAEPSPDRTVNLLVVADRDRIAASDAAPTSLSTRIAVLRDLGVEVTTADASLMSAGRAGMALRRRDPAADAIIEAHVAPPSLPAWLAARLARAPLVLHLGDAAFVEGSPAGRIGGTAGFTLRRASLVVTTSRSAAGALTARHPELAGRVVIEPQGVEIERFRHETAHLGADDAPVPPPVAVEHRRTGIVFVGPLTAGSGVDLLLDAVGRIEADGRPHVTIIGEGVELDALRSQAERLAVGATWQSDGGPDRIVHALRSAAIVVIPPLAGQDTTVAIQAMAAGAVVVASAAGALRETVDDGRNGILVEPGDPAALASGIRRAQIVARGDDRLRLMRTAAAATAAEHDIHAIARRALSRYRSLGG